MVDVGIRKEKNSSCCCCVRTLRCTSILACGLATPYTYIAWHGGGHTCGQVPCGPLAVWWTAVRRALCCAHWEVGVVVGRWRGGWPHRRMQHLTHRQKAAVRCHPRPPQSQLYPPTQNSLSPAGRPAFWTGSKRTLLLLLHPPEAGRTNGCKSVRAKLLPWPPKRRATWAFKPAKYLPTPLPNLHTVPRVQHQTPVSPPFQDVSRHLSPSWSLQLSGV